MNSTRYHVISSAAHQMKNTAGDVEQALSNAMYNDGKIQAYLKTISLSNYNKLLDQIFDRAYSEMVRESDLSDYNAEITGQMIAEGLPVFKETR